MTCAKALIDSGYEPDRTIVFVAIDAEEYGWTDTIFAWAIGSHFHAHFDHPDWGGNTRAFIEPSSCSRGDYALYVSGNPETDQWRRQAVLPAFDEYFSTHAPWSSYYQPSSTSPGKLPDTWIDTWNYGTSGIPTFEVYPIGSGLYYERGMYHCQNDTMDELISAESLAMGAIGNGLLTIRLDRALLAPYNFANWGTLIDKALDDQALVSAGISTRPINAKIDEFKEVGKSVWELIMNTDDTENTDAANALLMQTAKEIFSNLITVGGWGDLSFLPFEHYQVDSYALRKALDALERGGKIDKAVSWLEEVYGMYEGRNVDYEVYKHFIIDGTSPDAPGLLWAEGRVAHYSDVYNDYISLEEKAEADDKDYSAEIASLQPIYDTAVMNLEDAIQLLMDTLSTAIILLEEVEELLDT